MLLPQGHHRAAKFLTNLVERRCPVAFSSTIGGLILFRRPPRLCAARSRRRGLSIAIHVPSPLLRSNCRGGRAASASIARYCAFLCFMGKGKQNAQNAAHANYGRMGRFVGLWAACTLWHTHCTSKIHAALAFCGGLCHGNTMCAVTANSSVMFDNFSLADIDAVLGALEDPTLSQAEVDAVIAAHFPHLPTMRRYNGTKLSTDFWCEYGKLREIGLSARDAAAALEVPYRAVQAAMSGYALDREEYEAILQVEYRSEARLKKHALETIHDAIADGNYKAAFELLEKKFPKEWGKKAEITNNTTIKMSSEECERMAQQGTERLEQIRAQRERATQSNESITQSDEVNE